MRSSLQSSELVNKMTTFTPEQIEALEAPLAREPIRERDQAGRKVFYLEAWHVVAEANRIFGFGGWDREMVECRCVVERERKIGGAQKDGWHVGYTARVKITVVGEAIDGNERPTVREGTGYGSGIDVDLGAAHESAIKEAESDGTKRALSTFGNPFGLALYDKTYAHVEPPQRPVAAPAASPAPSPAAEGRRLRAIYDAIWGALETAQHQEQIDGILRVHADDLEKITDRSKEHADNMRAFAARRKALLPTIAQLKAQAAAQAKPQELMDVSGQP